jgi:hypothetical protein
LIEQATDTSSRSTSVRERAEIAGGGVTVLEGGEVELWPPVHPADAS